MVTLEAITAYCDRRTGRESVVDFPGARNGLQFSNSGRITKIGAAVDAGMVPFQKATEAGVDFLIVHHGLFWSAQEPVTGLTYEKYRHLFEHNLAVYSSHLPLDAHPEIGNNACIAHKLGLKPIEHFLEHEGTKIGLIAEAPESRDELSKRLKALFPKTFTAIEFGSIKPQRIGISSGSGVQVIGELKASGLDTLITGELRQHQFNIAQEEKFNLYPCGHYATEVFGVQELAKEVANYFNLPWEFIATDCPL